MKNFLRIAIVVLLLIGVGFGAYAVFFKPANDEAVFLALSEVGSEEEEETWDEMYKGLYFVSTLEIYRDSDKDRWYVSNVSINGIDNNRTYFSDGETCKNYSDIQGVYNPKLGMDSNFKFLGEPESPVQKTSEEIVQLNNDGSIKKDDKGNMLTETLTDNVYTYPHLKTVLDGIFSNYVSYSQAVTQSVDKSELNEIKELVENYKTALNDVNAKFKSIESLYSQICSVADGEDLSKELEMRYQNAVVSYRSYVNAYANLTERVISFVREYVFDDAVSVNQHTGMEEMKVKYIKSFTAGAYSYSTLDEAGQLGKRTSDLRNKELALSEQKSDTEFKYVKENTVTYDGNVYSSNVGYLVDSLTIRVGKNGGSTSSVYFGDSSIEVPTANVSGNNLTMLGKTYSELDENSSGVVTIENVIFEQIDSKVYMYLVESVDRANKIDVTGVAKLTANSVYFGSVDSKYTEQYAIKEFYLINSMRYGLNSSGVICELTADKLECGEELSGAVYNTYSQISDEVTGATSIDEKIFNKAYKKVFETDSKLIDTIINLNIDDMKKLESGNVDILSTFSESIQTELRILLIHMFNLTGEV